MTYYKPTLTVRFEWMTHAKHWRLTWSLEAPGQAHPITHWQVIETQEPITVLEAHRIADAITREMESWLPLYGPL